MGSHLARDAPLPVRSRRPHLPLAAHDPPRPLPRRRGPRGHRCRQARAAPGPRRLWEALEQATGVALDAAEERAIAARTILGWRAVKGLRDAGMDVQSHSHEHVVLNSLSPEVAQRDLARSARVLQDALGEAPYSVAYPVGYRLAGALRDATREARFEIGFTNGTGLCPPRIGDPLDVPRVSIDLGMGLGGAQAAAPPRRRAAAAARVGAARRGRAGAPRGGAAGGLARHGIRKRAMSGTWSRQAVEGAVLAERLRVGEVEPLEPAPTSTRGRGASAGCMKPAVGKARASASLRCRTCENASTKPRSSRR